MAIISVSSIAAIGFSGCSQEDVAMDTSRETNVIACSPMKIPLSEAMGNAERVMRLIENGKGTRTRTLEKVEYIATQGTRSGDADTLFYVVNYAGDNGFAVLSADRRLPEVYAISDEGHLDMNDTVFNKGLGLFFSSLPEIPPMIPDTLIKDPIKPPLPDIVDNSYRIDPMLDPMVRRWHQDSPFNLACPYVSSSKRGYVGCGPLSVGMIMSYYEWPLSYSNTPFDWAEMKKLDSKNPATSLSQLPLPMQALPKLLAWIGESMLALYYTDGTEVSTELVFQGTFRNFGYRMPSEFVEFNNNGLKKLIDSKKPAIVKSEGHVFVADGLVYDADVTRYTSGGMPYVDQGEGVLFHIIWGWGGSANGFFRFNNGFEHLKQFYDENDPAWQEYWADRLTPYFNIKYCGDFEPLR